MKANCFALAPALLLLVMQPVHATPPGASPSEEAASLTTEEELQLRAALNQVWNDAEVQQARDAAARAMENYRGVLESAIARSEPESMELIHRLHARTSSGSLQVTRLAAPTSTEEVHELVRRLVLQSPVSRLTDNEGQEHILQVAAEIVDSGKLNDLVNQAIRADESTEQGNQILRELRVVLLHELAQADGFSADLVRQLRESPLHSSSAEYSATGLPLVEPRAAEVTNP